MYIKIGIFSLVLILLALAGCSHQESVQTAFIIPEKDLIPEGMAYDPATKTFFVSSVAKRKIITFSLSGKAEDFISSGQDGIGEVLGMKVDPRKQQLWACSNTKGDTAMSVVHQFDIATRKLIRKYELTTTAETHLFNDLVIIDSGVYITDSDFDAVYRIKPGEDHLEIFLKCPDLHYCNGITTSLKGDHLMVSASSGVFSIDLYSRKLRKVNFPNYLVFGFDGLYGYNKSFIGIQNTTFPVSVNQFHWDNEEKEIERADNLVTNHPLFDTPTTGVIVDDWFYFIANSQLGNFDGAKILKPEDLREIYILKVKLN